MVYRSLLIAFLFLVLPCCKPGGTGTASAPGKAQVISVDEYRVWRLMDVNTTPGVADAGQLPVKYQILKLDIKKVKTRLRALEPQEKVPNQLRYEKTTEEDVLLQLPWNDGRFYTFTVKPSNIFSPELAKKFPDIRSYSGEKTDDGATHLRLDINPSGLYAMITAPSQTLFIRPLDEEGSLYLCYDKDDVDRDNKKYYEPPIKTRSNR